MTLHFGSSRQLAQDGCPGIATNPLALLVKSKRRRGPQNLRMARGVGRGQAASASGMSSTTEIFPKAPRLSAKVALQTLARSRS